MQTRIAAAVVLCAAGAMPARAAPPPPTDHAATKPAVEAVRGGLAPADRAFLIESAQAGHGLMFASARAVSRASDQRVRDYAARMIEQRTLVNAELEQVARAKGVVLPLEPAPNERSMLRRLEQADGAAFDQQYLDLFGIEAHRLGIRRWEAELNRGRDPDVKEVARRFLPTLRQHLREAQDLRMALWRPK